MVVQRSGLHLVNGSNGFPSCCWHHAILYCLHLKVYSADEAFVTGTFAGQIFVREVDGRTIGNGGLGPVTAKLQKAYAALCDAEAEKGRFPHPYVEASVQQIQEILNAQPASKTDPEGWISDCSASLVSNNLAHFICLDEELHT